MKKILMLILVTASLAACSGGKNTKIEDISKMELGEIEKVTKSLTPEEAKKVTQAIADCQANAVAEVCNKTIKEIIK
ncbi:hypothetical protein GKC56_05415 [Neisseriaceae bacterium PsAf]|nr:hypothetical protein [Neisseriaceae bacterium PsAf]MCV2503052.1 hypothetical protein [Neisseriaceae bacterium]